MRSYPFHIEVQGTNQDLIHYTKPLSAASISEGMGLKMRYYYQVIKVNIYLNQ